MTAQLPNFQLACPRDVEAAINAARSQLPADLPSQPTYRKVNSADSPVILLSVTSDTIPIGQIYDAADSILAQKIAQVEGVGQVFTWGSSRPAVQNSARRGAAKRRANSINRGYFRHFFTAEAAPDRRAAGR